MIIYEVSDVESGERTATARLKEAREIFDGIDGQATIGRSVISKMSKQDLVIAILSGQPYCDDG